MPTCLVPVVTGSQIAVAGASNPVKAIASVQFLKIDPSCSPGSYRVYTVDETSPLTITDGVQMGWAVAVVWIAAFAIRFIAGLIRDEMKGHDDVGNP